MGQRGSPWGYPIDMSISIRYRSGMFITDQQLKEKVDLFSPGLSGKPPVILVICSDMHKAARKGGKNSEVYGCLMDASMAAENLTYRRIIIGFDCTCSEP